MKVETEDSKAVRLDVFVARSTGLSRRKADLVISSGRVRVDGRVVDSPGHRVEGSQRVFLDGKRLRLPSHFTWIVMNKPQGYLTTRSDPSGRKTVMELLPDRYKRLFPVGRLDSATTGVLLLTDDGATAQRMLHPRYEVPRQYRVKIATPLTAAELRLIRRGVILDGRRAVPLRTELLHDERDGQIWLIELSEGRYHEVRRIFESIGHEVIALERISFAGIELGDLPIGRWRLLDGDEVKNRLERYDRDRY